MPSGPFGELEKEAEHLEKQSKEEFNKKNFSSAISFLKEAQKLYVKLGYQGKIGMINQRIAQLKNLVRHDSKDSVLQSQAEKTLQNSADKIPMNKKLSEQKDIPRETNLKLQQITWMLQKADKEEKLGKYSRVIGRYEYILEIYKAIPKEIMNLSNEIYTIEKKLATLRSKK